MYPLTYMFFNLHFFKQYETSNSHLLHNNMMLFSKIKNEIQSYIFRNKMDIYFDPKHQMKILKTTLFKLIDVKYFIMIL